MAADIAQLARTLNAVRSVGQARAALEVAVKEADWGLLGVVPALSFFSTPDPVEAASTLSIDRSQLSGELGTLEQFDPTSPVDPTSWARQRRAIERTFIDVSGMEGVVGALPGALDFLVILAQAIAEAPGLIADKVGAAAAAVAPAAFGLSALVIAVLLLIFVVKARVAA